MGQSTRPLSSSKPGAAQLKPQANSGLRQAEAGPNGLGRLAHAEGSPGKPTLEASGGPGIPGPSTNESPRSRVFGVGPSTLHRKKYDRTNKELRNLCSPTLAPRRASTDLTCLEERFHRLHLSESGHKQHGTSSNVPQRSGSAGRRSSGTKHSHYGSGTGARPPDRDAIRNPSAPRVKNGEATLNKDGLPNFACFCCKYRLLDARVRGLQTTEVCGLCQLVANERSVRRGSAKRHTPSQYLRDDSGRISEEQYAKLNREYYQRAVAAARRRNLQDRKKDEFIWRECCVAVYTNLANVKHLLNPYGYEDHRLNTARLRMIWNSEPAAVSTHQGSPAGLRGSPQPPQRSLAPAPAPTPTSSIPQTVPMTHFHEPITTTPVSVYSSSQVPNLSQNGGVVHQTWANVVAQGSWPGQVPNQIGFNPASRRTGSSDFMNQPSNAQGQIFPRPLHSMAPTYSENSNHTTPSRPQTYRQPLINHPQSTCTRNMPTVQPALPLVPNEMRPMNPMTQHQNAPSEGFDTSTFLESRPRTFASDYFSPIPSNYWGSQGSTDDNSTLRPASNSAEHTGLVTPSSQRLTTPSFERSSNTGQSSTRLPPTPRGPVPSSPTPLRGAPGDLSGLGLSNNAFATVPEKLEGLPESEERKEPESWLQYLNQAEL